jgi:aminoglycoside phosphotransferase (APT) family kinase protein
MLNPDVLVRYYGLPTERVANNPGSKTAPVWKAVKRENGTTDYIQQPDENTYEKIQKAGEGYDLASAIARLEAGDTSIKAKSMVYTEGTDLENLPKDIMTMHEKADAAAETLAQLKQVQQTEQPKPEEEKKEEVKNNEQKQ